ncbi:MAG: acyl-CoA dehydrogenase, partial [Acidobacteria bacterium]|nr:acyl-CoA dehydrogenase [Acidobacteriota bacterium]
IADELFAMAASVSRLQAMKKAGNPEAKSAQQLVDLFCRNSRRKVKRLFKELWSNDDVVKYKAARAVLDGEHRWLEALVADSMPPVPEAAKPAVREEEPAPVAAG